MESRDNHIDYLEFKATDLAAIKAFYSKTFGWEFTDYGPTYVAFANSGLQGGFELTDAPIVNGVLPVLYHANLVQAKAKVEASGGTISCDIFSFPGGKRFHFLDPSGNELAIWAEN